MTERAAAERAGPMRGAVFDLDDTLYLERDYVRSGFQALARIVAGESGYGSSEIFEYLYGLFEGGARGDTLDRLLEGYPRIASRYRAEDLVRLYREHEPAIELCPGAGEILDELRRLDIRCAIITDGPRKSQQRKLEALPLGPHRIDRAILTDAWGRDYWKPHPRAFQEIAIGWGLSSGELVYVGDNPAKDFLAPRRLGWRTIRVRSSGQEHFGEENPSAEHAADVEVEDFSGLARELRALR